MAIYVSPPPSDTVAHAYAMIESRTRLTLVHDAVAPDIDVSVAGAFDMAGPIVPLVQTWAYNGRGWVRVSAHATPRQTATSILRVAGWGEQRIARALARH